MGRKAESVLVLLQYLSKEHVYFCLFSTQSGLIQSLLVLYAALWEQHITAERDVETSHLHPLPSVSSSSSHHGNKSPRSDNNRGSRRKWTRGHVTKRLIDPADFKTAANLQHICEQHKPLEIASRRPINAFVFWERGLLEKHFMHALLSYARLFTEQVVCSGLS